jgi:hypothetical protein
MVFREGRRQNNVAAISAKEGAIISLQLKQQLKKDVLFTVIYSRRSLNKILETENSFKLDWGTINFQQLTTNH